MYRVKWLIHLSLSTLHSFWSVILNLHLLAVLSILGFVASAVALFADAPAAPLILVRVPLSAMALVAVRVHYCVRQMRSASMTHRLSIGGCGHMNCLRLLVAYRVTWRLLVAHRRSLVTWRRVLVAWGLLITWRLLISHRWLLIASRRVSWRRLLISHGRWLLITHGRWLLVAHGWLLEAWWWLLISHGRHSLGWHAWGNHAWHHLLQRHLLLSGLLLHESC